MVVIWTAVPPDSGFPPVVLATVAVRAVPPLLSSAVTRISSVCPLLAVTLVLSSVVTFALPIDPAAKTALMPSKMSGLERSCVRVQPPPS